MCINLPLTGQAPASHEPPQGHGLISCADRRAGMSYMAGIHRAQRRTRRVRRSRWHMRTVPGAPRMRTNPRFADFVQILRKRFSNFVEIFLKRFSVFASKARRACCRATLPMGGDGTETAGRQQPHTRFPDKCRHGRAGLQGRHARRERTPQIGHVTQWREDDARTMPATAAVGPQRARGRKT